MIIDYEDFGLYDGEVDKDGNPHGHGRLTYADGGYYDGEFVHGTIEGFGIMVYAEDEYYEGHFANNDLHGHGKFRYPSGLIEEGEWDDGFVVERTIKRTRAGANDLASIVFGSKPPVSSVAQAQKPPVSPKSTTKSSTSAVKSTGETTKSVKDTKKSTTTSKSTTVTTPKSTTVNTNKNTSNTKYSVTSTPKSSEPKSQTGYDWSKFTEVTDTKSTTSFTQKAEAKVSASNMKYTKETILNKYLEGPNTTYVKKSDSNDEDFCGPEWPRFERIAKLPNPCEKLKGLYTKCTLVHGDLKYVGEYITSHSSYDFSGPKCPHGFGTFYRGRVLLYAGSFVKGDKEGYGYEYDEATGDIYEGYFKESRRHGKGRLQRESGAIHETIFVDGKANGTYSRHKYADGTLYEGYYYLDTEMRVGYGTMYDSEGTYEGGWHLDEWRGEGIYETKSGDTYIGIWNGIRCAVDVIKTDAFGKKTEIKNQKI